MIISTFECKSFVQNSDITHKIIQSMFHGRAELDAAGFIRADENDKRAQS